MKKNMVNIGTIMVVGAGIVLAISSFRYFGFPLSMAELAFFPSTIFLPFVIWFLTGDFQPFLFLVWGIGVAGIIIATKADKANKEQDEN